MLNLLNCGVHIADNLGVPSALLTTMIANAAANVDVLYNRVGGKQICFIWGGTNDMALNGASSATIFANIKVYANARKAVGWKVIVISMLPRQNNAGFETTRTGVNTLLRADSASSTADPMVFTGASYCDALIDVGVDANIGQFTSPSNATYYTDTIHMTNAGYAILAAAAKTAILLM